MDISLSYEQYQRMSMNEQREALGIHLYSYLAESIAKYTKHADKTVQDQLLQLVKSWMLANHWLEGKIHQARILLSQEMGLYEVIRTLKMPLEEIEYILLRMNDDAPAAVHPDHL
ncbi:hypothetical protein [Paenibacillus sp. MMS20-IR301]|uniref:hypothetical protein n=1 Tax=Paenibacillus sp. MMS20-IR301 TaxID=2895946 RepID=UPI0028E8CB8F|nr:hypothetical protein [Paenibacillus sp. MMS20-IR301]WNS42299.1 hypothetical protein LOS79_25450 [Paenibacillus sp. MMS20-IR301]